MNYLAGRIFGQRSISEDECSPGFDHPSLQYHNDLSDESYDDPLHRHGASTSSSNSSDDEAFPSTPFDSDQTFAASEAMARVESAKARSQASLTSINKLQGSPKVLLHGSPKIGDSPASIRTIGLPSDVESQPVIPPSLIRGRLTVKLFKARSLRLPTSKSTKRVLAPVSGISHHSPQPTVAAVSAKARERVQRQRNWWLPYAIAEYDKTQVLIDALGGSFQEPEWMFGVHFDVSRTGYLTVSTYLRTSEPSLKNHETSFGDDLFLAVVRIYPNFSPNEQTSGDEWCRAVSGTAEFHVKWEWTPQVDKHLSIEDFELLTVVGKGSYGKVMQVRKKDSGRIYALKTIKKATIKSNSDLAHTLAERTVLSQVNSPFVTSLKFSFQSKDKLYLVLSFINGGELFHHLQKAKTFNEDRTKFYAAELLCALEHLHALGVIYRDLKPENILLDYTGHLILCDFGLCKINMKDDDRTKTICGTPEYIAPEILLGKGYSKQVDWWTLGVIIFEMLNGQPPFWARDRNHMFRNILYKPLVIPSKFSPECQSILKSLLERDPSKRLGVHGAMDIKRHGWFSEIDWDRLAAKKVTPPFKPNVSSAVDTSNFDTEFTSLQAEDSVVEDSHLAQSIQDQFKGFTFAPSNMGVISP